LVQKTTLASAEN